MRLRVCETFTSIQGESSHAGRLCFFIRLSGCPLRCRYCDTAYARDPEVGAERSVDELVREASLTGIDLVEITGGEPLAQPESLTLMRKLTDRGFEVLLETSGALPVAAVPEAVRRIIDYKLPSSGMNDRMLPENFRHLRPHDEVKFVIGDAADYDCAAAAVRAFDLAAQTPHILYSPVWGGMPFRELAERIIADRLPGRMQIQLHKIIWGPERTGV